LRWKNNIKITTFNPLIVTARADELISLFKDLGFEVRHEKKELDSVATRDVRMRNANGNHIDIVQMDQMPQNLTQIRMNVDNFDEAYAFLTEKGFTNPRGGQTVDTKTNKSCMMRSPSGFAFDLCQHIKD
jgi:uncharacterized protein YhaN